MQSIIENVFCHNNFIESHVTVDDPDSCDSSRLYPNERYFNLIPTQFLHSAPKEVFTSKMNAINKQTSTSCFVESCSSICASLLLC
jgi:hypothetical protein